MSAAVIAADFDSAPASGMRGGLLDFAALHVDAVAEHGPQLAGAFPARHVVEMELHELLRHRERLGLVAELEDGVAADDFLGFHERAVGDAELAAFDRDVRALLQRRQTAHVDHPAGLDLAFGELAHRLHQSGGRAFHRLRGDDDGHEAHEKLPVACELPASGRQFRLATGNDDPAGAGSTCTRKNFSVPEYRLRLASHIAVPALDGLAYYRRRNLVGDLDVPYFAFALRGEVGEQLRDIRHIAYLVAAQAEAVRDF